MNDKKHDTKIEKHEVEPVVVEKHAKAEKTADKVIVKPITINKCFGPKTMVTPPATIGTLWADHPWIVMQPDYTNHIFREIPNCPYPKHTVLLDEANGIKFTKYIGDIAMDAKGFIQGLFWVATAIEDTAEPPVVQPPPMVQSVTVGPLDAATVLALAVGYELVPAPVTVGETLEFVSAEMTYTYGSFPYAAGAQELLVRYQDSAGAVVSTSLPATGFLTATVNMTETLTPIVVTRVPNAALVLHMINGNVTAGNGTLTVITSYRVHPPPVVI